MGRRPISQRPGRAAHPAPRQWDEIVKAAQSLLRENTDRVDAIKEASVASWPRSCRRATKPHHSIAGLDTGTISHRVCEVREKQL